VIKVGPENKFQPSKPLFWSGGHRGIARIETLAASTLAGAPAGTTMTRALTPANQLTLLRMFLIPRS